ncbi:Wyosine [tRNA(Phe)-imidazoG37] synthetase, radical SAM superfamily [Candidatus Methanophagaceae archaeon]|nr:Wyosine [tRNA(Phe)-imidazoG37] synthetase, radical SAM superfamily [Methanophagales archaeon]
MEREMSTIYGPVPSWRLGKSLGFDLITKDKVCSFDCVYCQLGCTKEKSVKRAIFVDTELVKLDLSEALDALEEGDVDFITFSGMGESTLASNLDEAIEVVRAITDLPITILTNASLLHLKEVQITLSKLDKVITKLDAPNSELLRKINKPHASISIDDILNGLKGFRRAYAGEFELQMMFINENKGCAEDLARIAAAIKPERVDINTPLRPCSVEPLSREQINRIKNINETPQFDFN